MPRFPITINAPAKINLYLHITGRDDVKGYHALDSIFIFTDINDVLSLNQNTEKSPLIIDGTYRNDLMTACPDSNENIIIKSAKAFLNLLGKADADLNGYQFTLTKNIPLGAGLGGGSSNAAAAIKLLMHAWEIDLNDLNKSAFDTMLFNLGADVPACFYQKSTRLLGAGTELSDAPKWLNHEQLHGVIIYPNAHNDTAAIFKEYKKQPSHFSSIIDITQTDIHALMAETRNDLTRPAMALCPDIKQAFKALDTCEPMIAVRMSGSGSSVFAFFDSKQTAQNIAKSLKQTHPHWWTRTFNKL